MTAGWLDLTLGCCGSDLHSAGTTLCTLPSDRARLAVWAATLTGEMEQGWRLSSQAAPLFRKETTTTPSDLWLSKDVPEVSGFKSVDLESGPFGVDCRLTGCPPL